MASHPILARGIKDMILDETDPERHDGQNSVSIHEMVNALIGGPALVGCGIYLIITTLQKTAPSTPRTWTEINFGFEASIVIAVSAGLGCVAGGIYLFQCGRRLHRLFRSQNVMSKRSDTRP